MATQPLPPAPLPQGQNIAPAYTDAGLSYQSNKSSMSTKKKVLIGFAVVLALFIIYLVLSSDSDDDNSSGTSSDEQMVNVRKVLADQARASGVPEDQIASEVEKAIADMSKTEEGKAALNAMAGGISMNDMMKEKMANELKAQGVPEDQIAGHVNDAIAAMQESGGMPNAVGPDAYPPPVLIDSSSPPNVTPITLPGPLDEINGDGSNNNEPPQTSVATTGGPLISKPPAVVVVPVKPTLSRISTFQGTFHADNFLSVVVLKKNGSKSFNKNYSQGWTQRINVDIPNVEEGDTMMFMVENLSGPGGFIGKWNWNGKTYNTKKDGVFKKTSTPVKIIGNAPEIWGGVGQEFSPNAQWLWASNNCENCVVQFIWTVG